MITNNPTDRGEHIQDLRDAIEHRATWFYFLVEEAMKRGLDYDFARAAIKGCGCFHGNNKYTKTDDLAVFAPEFINANVKSIFDMDVSVDEKELKIDFH
ncbi:MAG: hypothetical protein RRY54_04435, partial [Angelakisella sp.]